MNDFCNKHIGLRSIEELLRRQAQLDGLRNTGPGQRAELCRIILELDRRNQTEVAHAQMKMQTPFKSFR